MSGLRDKDHGPSGIIECKLHARYDQVSAEAV